MAVISGGGAINLSARAIGAQGGAFEPQRQNNWVIEITIPGILPGTSIPIASVPRDAVTLALQRGFNPSSVQEDVRVDWMNEAIFFAGKHVPDPGTVEVLDWVDISTADVLWSWRLQAYDPNTGDVGLARNYKTKASIINFAPDGSFQRAWKLEGVWPFAINYGGLDMTSSAPVLIAMQIRYDRYFRASALSGNSIGG